MLKNLSAIFLIVVLLFDVVAPIKFKHAMAMTFQLQISTKKMKASLMELMQEAKDATSIKTFNKLIEKVQEMLTNLQDEQTTHAENMKKMSDQCAQEIAFREVEAVNGNKAAENARIAVNACSAALNAASQTQTKVQETRDQIKRDLDEKQKIRDEEHKYYLDKKDSLKDALADASTFKSQLEVEPSNLNFISISQKLVNHSAQAGALSESIPILIALAQDTPDTLQKLKGQVDILIQKLTANHQLNEEIEAKMEKAFTSVKNDGTTAINKLNDLDAQLEKQAAEMLRCTKEENVILDQALAKTLRNDKLKNQAQVMCKQFAAEFEQATKNRSSNIEVLAQVLEIVKDRLGRVPDKISRHLESVQNGFIDYINSTEFKKYQEYAHQNIDDNARGRELAEKNKI